MARSAQLSLAGSKTYLLNCRVDADGVLFAHPQIPLPLCELLRIPALENAVKESLDTATELVKAQDIQVAASFTVQQFLDIRAPKSGTICRQ